MLADAVVLGVVAGIVGTLRRRRRRRWPSRCSRESSTLPGPFDIPWASWSGSCWSVSATALLRRARPGSPRRATDVVAALAGRRGVIRPRFVAPIIGAVIAAIGVAVGLGDVRDVHRGSVLLGMTLVEVGLIVTSPALIGIVTRLARWLPVSGRIALRDAGRNRAAAAPAVAAVMATVIGAMAAGIGAASSTPTNASSTSRSCRSAMPTSRSVRIRPTPPR